MAGSRKALNNLNYNIRRFRRFYTLTMDLIKFRVTMYKGIKDSRWVDVNDLTVLVGKNESGKTSLLKALHKLNPYVPDPNDDNPNSYGDNSDSYDINREYPRAQWKRAV